jgi:cobalamin biosynthesis Mg chelatase CobN
MLTNVLNYVPYCCAFLQQFRDIVMSYNLFCTIRRHHGRDIDGACGQLALRTEAEESAAKKQSGCSGDIEDLGAANRSTNSSSQKRANGSKKQRKDTDASQSAAAAAAAASVTSSNSTSTRDGKADARSALAVKLLLVGAAAAAVLVVAGLRLRLRGDAAIRRR